MSYPALFRAVSPPHPESVGRCWFTGESLSGNCPSLRGADSPKGIPLPWGYSVTDVGIEAWHSCLKLLVGLTEASIVTVLSSTPLSAQSSFPYCFTHAYP